MAGSSGVFIRCNRRNDRDCYVAIKSLMEPESPSCVKRDDTYSGLKVYIKDDSTVRNILKEQQLCVSGKMFPIHSLTTTLIIHTDLSRFPPEFEEILRTGVRHIGPPLEICRIPLFDDIPDSYSPNWKIILDIPEIEDLDVFHQVGLPNDMILKLPKYTNGFRVTFGCSFCDKDGHTLKRCPQVGSSQETPERQVVTQSSSINSNETARDSTPISSSSQGASEFQMREPKERVNIVRPAIPSNDIENWARKFGEETVRQELTSDSFSTTIKSETGQEAENSRSSKKRTHEESGNDDMCSDENYEPSSKYRHEGSTLFGSRFNPVFGDLEVVYESRGSSQKTFPHCSAEIRKQSNQDDAGQVPTSSRPEVTDTVKPELPSTDEDEDSNQNPPHAAATVYQTPRRRKPTQTTQIKIPEGIRIIIRQDSGILSEERLEAFFNHVKKKSCPSAVARQYTDDVQSLKAQLQGIKDRYYNTPIIHSAEEKYFMKWFENVLTRFDRKPIKKPSKNAN